MDILYFLTERTKFIRQLYDNSTAPFIAIKRKIEAEEPPYLPSYSEDGEPHFLTEWIEVDTSINLLGVTCVSMLSESMKLYFLTLAGQLGHDPHCEAKKSTKGGFIAKYRACFGACFGVDWKQCPADLEIVEQITLARNRGQHPDEITMLNLQHSADDLVKYPSPFFLDDRERKFLSSGQGKILLDGPGTESDGSTVS